MSRCNFIGPSSLLFIFLILGTFSFAAHAGKVVVEGVPYVVQRSHLD
jgi:hypothetical protein